MKESVHVIVKTIVSNVHRPPMTEEEDDGSQTAGELNPRETLVVEHRIGPLGTEDISPREEDDWDDYSSCFKPSTRLEEIDQEIIAEKMRSREESRGGRSGPGTSVSEYRKTQQHRKPPQSSCCILL